MKLLAVIFSFVVLFSCSKDKGSLNNIGGPKWIFDPYSVSKNPNEVAGVGISDPTHGGIKIQIAQAENDAIANMAAQIQTKVDRVTEDALSKNESIVAASADKKSTVESKEDVQKKFSQITKNVVDKLPISGARRTDIWQDPNSGTLYVRMVIEVAKIEDHFKKSVSMYQNLAAMGVDKKAIETLTRSVLGANFKDIAQSENANKGNTAEASPITETK